MAVADKFANKPVVFIAVNSGREPKDVKKYVSSNKVNWPVIIDMDRTFESRAKVNEISTSNIWQFRSIDAEGNMTRFSGSDIVPTTERLLKNAKWEVDPKLIPESLTQTHRLVEFGMYSLAADQLNAASKNRDAEVKAGATALLEHVNEQIAEKLQLAHEAKENGEAWKAYKIYSETGEQFDGYKMETDLRTMLKKLKAEDEVKDQFAAKRQFDNAKKQFARNGMKRTIVSLKKIIDKYPDTEAAGLSREVIETLEAGDTEKKR